LLEAAQGGPRWHDCWSLLLLHAAAASTRKVVIVVGLAVV
jgi:hypothetical protein